MKRFAKLMIVVLALALAAPAFAETKRSKDDAGARAVQGTVTDGADKQLDGAVVQLKDTKTLQVHSFITKEDGAYHFSGLNPNVDYELKADYQGASSASKTLNSFDSRKMTILNLKVAK